MSRVLRRRLRTPELDVAWRDAEYCVADVETTGLDLRRDALISFGSVLIKAGRLQWNTRTYVDVRPERPISAGAAIVHGIRQQDLADAPALRDVADAITAELDGRVLVAHAAWIERAFLARPVRASRRSWRPAIVDTAALLRATGLAPSGTGYEPEVETTGSRLGICVHTPHHALGDALTTAEIFLALAARLEHDEPTLTARGLVDLSHRHAHA
jgi:DNA polymerase-3 subunit epsilon